MIGPVSTELHHADLPCILGGVSVDCIGTGIGWPADTCGTRTALPRHAIADAYGGECAHMRQRWMPPAEVISIVAGRMPNLTLDDVELAILGALAGGDLVARIHNDIDDEEPITGEINPRTWERIRTLRPTTEDVAAGGAYAALRSIQKLQANQQGWDVGGVARAQRESMITAGIFHGSVFISRDSLLAWLDLIPTIVAATAPLESVQRVPAVQPRRTQVQNRRDFDNFAKAYFQKNPNASESQFAMAAQKWAAESGHLHLTRDRIRSALPRAKDGTRARGRKPASKTNSPD